MLDDLIPKSWKEADLSHNKNESLRNARQVLNAYLPWYMVRAKLLSGLSISLDEQHKLAATVSSKSLSNRYLEFDPVPFEISKARFFNLMLAEHNVEQELQLLEGETIKFSFSDRLSVLRSAYRVPHLKDIADTLEDACYQSLKGINEEGAEKHANDLIALARAVLASSKESSEFYFEEAVKIVSRFGDEAVERWEAVVSIAKHRASFGIVDPETAYRFMRCAELIGNTVAREKHWDRYDAMATCCLLHPASAFAIASRWVDRDVGWDDRTHRALLETALQTNAISPSSAWALSAFTFEYGLIEFADLCIDKENDIQKKQTIFSYLVDDYRRQGVTGGLWLDIVKLAEKHNLKHEELTHIELLAIEETKERSSGFTVNNDVEELIDCEEIYDDVDFSTSHGLHEAITKFKKQRTRLDFDTFWKDISSRLSSANFVEYLNIISSSDYLDLYDIRLALKNIPDRFKTKPNMKKAWKIALEKIAANYPKELINSYYRDSVLNTFEYDKAVVDTINKGVVKGLTEHSSLEVASTFYNFANSFAQKLEKNEVESILDFALLRFELHIEEDYADGPWRDDISAPANPISSLAGYVWASLGSPEAARRWSAAHVVRRLYRLGCKQEIEELIKWMDHKPIICHKINRVIPQ